MVDSSIGDRVAKSSIPTRTRIFTVPQALLTRALDESAGVPGVSPDAHDSKIQIVISARNKAYTDWLQLQPRYVFES